MRLVFLGTPEFAVPALEACVRAGHEIAAVVTQPDRPRGRGQQTAFSPVKDAALRLGLAVHQPERVRRPEAVELLASLSARCMVVVGYGQIIPQSVIGLPPLGIVNVHASLLPRYRGAAPIQWAIASGETVTGVTTMQIDAGLDTGGILLARETAIGPEETAPELSKRLAGMGAELLVETLAGLAAGRIVARPQDPALATLAPILKKEDGHTDWSRSAREIHNRARGFQPWPGAQTVFRGQALTLWKTCPAAETAAAAPGTIVRARKRLVVACGGETCLELLEVQMEGRKRIPAGAFLNGQHVKDNEVLGELA
ncbi:MAG: methionyl-tRNA formyltransferase [Acidobacteria bacterium]|nr:methionyl-tRNA formyltransferase [Acidobacteriota bacterium]